VGVSVTVVDLFVLGGGLGVPEVVLHPVTAATRIWCSLQPFGYWTGDVLVVSVVDHIEAVLAEIPDDFNILMM
jgi:hypothetical protein